jgi:hypothetical protein
MPQASDALRRYWGGADSTPAIAHLESRGYTLTAAWTWIPPGDLTYSTMPRRDFLAIKFLMDEWDFGGLER